MAVRLLSWSASAPVATSLGGCQHRMLLYDEVAGRVILSKPACLRSSPHTCMRNITGTRPEMLRNYVKADLRLRCLKNTPSSVANQAKLLLVQSRCLKLKSADIGRAGRSYWLLKAGGTPIIYNDVLRRLYQWLFITSHPAPPVIR